MAMVNVKKTMKEIHSGVFQKTSNWQTIPVKISMTVVKAEKTMPTVAQLIQ